VYNPLYFSRWAFHPVQPYDNFPNVINHYYGREQNQVDVTVFSHSLEAYKQLLHDASTVLNYLADSKPFATKVMGAAQISDTKEVERLIHSIGVKSKFKVTYNPDGIHLKFWTDVYGTECCQLDMAIRWR